MRMRLNFGFQKKRIKVSTAFPPILGVEMVKLVCGNAINKLLVKNEKLVVYKVCVN